MTFERLDVVVVPFPFTDRNVKIRRPAVILSGTTFAAETGQSLLAMVTRAERSTWPGDLPIRDLVGAGLSGPCVVRLKLFTLVNSLIARRLGRLSDEDGSAFDRVLGEHLGLVKTRDR